MPGPWERYASQSPPPPQLQMGGGLGEPSGLGNPQPPLPGGLGAVPPPIPTPPGPWSRYAQPAAAPPQDPSAWMAPIGGAEILLSGATALPAKAIAGLGGIGNMGMNLFRDQPVDSADVVRDLEHQFTYQPRSDSAQAGAALIGKGMDWADRNLAEPVLQRIGDISPTAENVVRTAVPAVAEAVSVAAPIGRTIAGGAFRVSDAAARETAAQAAARAAEKAGPTAEEVLSKMTMDSPQSMGAAAAAPSLTNVSQELKDAITTTAQRTGGVINPEVLSRHVEADTLPVPVRLTAGQATQDPILISKEMNTRGRSDAMVKRYNEQNGKLAQNVQAIRDDVGPDVFSTNSVEHADRIIAGYRAKNETAQKQIGAKYKELRDANGGQFPVDAQALMDSAAVELHKRMLYDFAPSKIMGQLERLATSNSMTFENFEAMRTNLARIQRSPNIDGNEKAAAGVIRDAMEQLPMRKQTATLKPIADEARGLARTQFKALEADPAYYAAVNETVPADKFINKFLIGGNRDDVITMRANLADDDAALQTMGVAALDFLRGGAKLSPDYAGNFASAGYNKSLQSLAPKLRTIFSANTADQLERLGSVAGYTTFQPKGSYVNNSNTFVASAADKAADLAEKLGNVVAPGLDLGTMARDRVQVARTAREAQRSLAPGSGLDRLAEPPPKKNKP